MANKTLQTTLKKILTDGSVYTIYMKNRAKDVVVDDKTTMADIATKVSGMATGATKVAKSSSNGYILINGTSTAVYTHPASGVTAGTYNKVTVDKNGHVTSGSNVTNWTGTTSGDSSSATVAFTEASERVNVATGEKLSTMFGKIAKYLGDLKNMAFVDSVGTANLDDTLTTFYNNAIQKSNVTESTSITEAGWVSDARAIASLQNQINTINSNLSGLNSNIQDRIPGNTSVLSFIAWDSKFDILSLTVSGKDRSVLIPCTATADQQFITKLWVVWNNNQWELRVTFIMNSVQYTIRIPGSSV